MNPEATAMKSSSSALVALVAALTLPALSSSARAGGVPPEFIENQQGFLPASWAPDASSLLVTRWDRAGLWLLDLDQQQLQLLSEERSAGFHPVWFQDRVFFKETLPDGRGGRLQRLLSVSLTTGEREILDEGPQIGEPSTVLLEPGPGGAARGLLCWTNQDLLTLRELLPEGAGAVKARVELPGHANLVELDPSGSRVLFNHPDGRIGILEIESGRVRWLSEPGAASHPSWSHDGARVLFRVDGEHFRVLRSSGELVAELRGSEPSFLPDSWAVLFHRAETEPFRVLGSDLWLLEADAARPRPLAASPAHERAALPSPDGAWIALTDTRRGDILLRSNESGALGMLLAADADSLESPPPPPGRGPVVDVPYMHQLWDTPDDFNGGWSCGPTSCVQTIQRWSMLPDADMTCSWPYSHVSHWGWYIPNLYSFNGYTYDTWGEAASEWVQGAHGFICRSHGGAVWNYMVDFCDQHGVDSAWAGTSYSTLQAEVNAGYPMTASTSVLGYGHIIVMRGYTGVGAMVVNDPYGDAGTGDWGNYDGEAAIYDWPGYDNGYLEISVSQVFYAHGPDLPDTPDWDASLVLVDAPLALGEGERGTVVVSYLNTGAQSWEPGATNLGTSGPQDRSSVFQDESWLGATRTVSVGSSTGAGVTGTFTFDILAPTLEDKKEQSYHECFALVEEGIQWFGPEACFDLTVVAEEGNHPPEADAGQDQYITLGERVELDGRDSEDPDGKIERWTWTLPDGTTLDGDQVRWEPSTPGIHSVILEVEDDEGDEDQDRVQITVQGSGLQLRGGDDSSEGCSCGRGRSTVGWGALLPLLLLLGRRRSWHDSRRGPRRHGGHGG